MNSQLEQQKKAYAELLVHVGINLQPGQSLRISAEIAHRAFTRMVVAAAYGAGAKYVQLDWIDTPTSKQRLLHSDPDNLDYYPGYEVDKHRYLLDEGWARLALVGPEYPDVFDDIEPSVIRRSAVARSQMLQFYMDKMMANYVQWCVAGVPTRAWAMRVFPELPGNEAIDELWRTVLMTCRVNQTDPVAAWHEHDDKLKKVVDSLADSRVQSVQFVDSVLDDDGKPMTDLVVGLTDQPVWLGAASYTPEGTIFFANMPTEEVFTTPHRLRTEGYVRISKPAFPFEREVRDAYFRFERGEVVEFSASKGEGVLEELFTIENAKRLGEVALVDTTSPIYQSGLLFYETLFDENAACHIAFGHAYPDGIEGGADLSPDDLSKAGANQSPSHVDVMIGTDTMNVYGECADGSTVSIMENGRFVDFHEDAG